MKKIVTYPETDTPRKISWPMKLGFQGLSVNDTPITRNLPLAERKAA